MTSVQARFVLVTYVHIKNILADFDQTLMVGSWDHLEHIPTVKKIQPKKFGGEIFLSKKIFQQKKLPNNFDRK